MEEEFPRLREESYLSLRSACSQLGMSDKLHHLSET